MKEVRISDNDENADWIKWRTDDTKVSEKAKEFLKKSKSNYVKE